MKKLSWLGFLLLALAVILIGCSNGASQDEEENIEDQTTENEANNEQVEENASNKEQEVGDQEIIEIAQTFITQLSEGKYEEATERFDTTMSEQVTPESLNEVWTTLETQVGNYIDHEYQSTEEADGYRIVLITGIFNNDDVTFRVTFNEEQQIAGFFVQ